MESYAGNEPRIGIVRTAMGACAQIAVLFDTWGVIIKFSQLSPGSLTIAGLNYQILCVTPHTLV